MVLSMASGWVLVDRVFQHQSLPPGTSAFVAGHGVPYSSPDRTFDARFPSAPTVQRKVIPVASSSATINLAQVQTDDYEVVAASLVLPVPVPPDRIDTVLHDILLEGTIATDQKITSEKKVVRDGATGLEVPRHGVGRIRLQADRVERRDAPLPARCPLQACDRPALPGPAQLLDHVLTSRRGAAGDGVGAGQPHFLRSGDSEEPDPPQVSYGELR